MPCLSELVMAILPRESLAEGRTFATNDRADIVSWGRGLSGTSSLHMENDD